MKKFAQCILDGKNCLKDRLRYCCITNAKQIESTLIDFLPYAESKIASVDSNEIVTTSDFGDFVLTIKYSIEKRPCGWFIKEISAEM